MSDKKQIFVFNPNKRITNVDFHKDTTYVSDSLFFKDSVENEDYELKESYGETFLLSVDKKKCVDICLDEYFKEVDYFYLLDSRDERKMRKGNPKKFEEYKKQKREITNKIKIWQKLFKNRAEIFLNKTIDECWRYLLDYSNGIYWKDGIRLGLYQVNEDTFILEESRDYGESLNWILNK